MSSIRRWTEYCQPGIFEGSQLQLTSMTIIITGHPQDWMVTFNPPLGANAHLRAHTLEAAQTEAVEMAAGFLKQSLEQIGF